MQGKELDPEAVTQDLGLEPSLVSNIGDRIGNRIRNEAVWEYNGHPEDDNWQSIEDGLLFVLNRLWPLREKLDKYRLKADLFLWVGQFQMGLSGGPILSPSLLRNLADFGVQVAIDCYFSAPEK
jgi:hypothetical protein